MENDKVYVLVTYNNIRREIPIEKIRGLNDEELFDFLDDVFKCGYNNGYAASMRHI